MTRQTFRNTPAFLRCRLFSRLVLLASWLTMLPLAANAAGIYLPDANGCQVWDANPLPNERVTWSGGCKDGKADGQGRIEWLNDGKVSGSEEGPFREGRMNGHGVINYSNGTRFEGTVTDGVAQIPESEKFAIKERTTGSVVARGAVTNIVIPPDKTYAELSLDQQNLLKRQYQPMRPGDEPPYPLYGTYRIYDAIRAAQRKLAVEGTLDMVVQIDDKGKATSVAVLSSPDPVMTRAAASILMMQQYKPAVCGGTPCAMQYPFGINFANPN